MRSRKTLLSLLLTVFALSCVLLIDGYTASDSVAEVDTFTLVGVKTCKMCHKKDISGNQYGVWLEGPHATAFETLASDESKAIAEEQGLGNPQEEPFCLKCHATAFPVVDDLANQKVTLEEGVSCESCHGPGSAYKKKKTMLAIYYDEIEGESVGYMTIGEETCTACHNPESPTYKEFNYEERSQEALHPYPEGYEPKKKTK